MSSNPTRVHEELEELTALNGIIVEVLNRLKEEAAAEVERRSSPIVSLGQLPGALQEARSHPLLQLVDLRHPHTFFFCNFFDFLTFL